MKIQDGTGGGDWAGVDSTNHLLTVGHSDTLEQRAIEGGQAWSINTGTIELTNAATENAMLYLKNTSQSSNIICKVWIWLFGHSTGASTDWEMQTLYGSAMTGTIISDANAPREITNKFIGSAKLLDADVFAASASGKTIADETGILVSTLRGSASLSPEFIAVPTVIAPGQEVCMTVNTPTGNSSMTVQAIMDVYVPI